ncbi:MAG: hypothetical protein KF886_24715 [Candidatus Hydrogenedentes bacterium]|nr:hypothetical protein [Candidatus Hydrogenedentota bacterium]
MAEALYRARETTLEKGSQIGDSSNLAEQLESVKIIESELLRRGTEILPAVERMLWDSTRLDLYRARLIFSLKEIDGVEIDQFLVRVSFADHGSVGAAQGRLDVIGAARNALIWRGTHGKSIGVPLSPEHLNTLLVTVREGNNSDAMNAAALLAAFTENIPETRIKPVVERLIRVQEDHSDMGADVTSSISNYDKILGMHVGIFQSFGVAAQPYLREALIDSEVGGEAAKWLTLALGFAGDRSVAEDVRAIANNPNETVEVRCIAIGSYSAAAGTDALPQLEEWKKDTTIVVSEMHGWETRPIALTANEKWLQLRQFGETR